MQVPLTPPPAGAASIFCAHRQHGRRRWRWNGTGGVDFLPHHHTSSSVRSAGKHDDARLAGTVSSGASLFWFGSVRFARATNPFKRQHTGRDEREDDLSTRDREALSCLIRCKPYRERVGCSNPNAPPRPHFRFIRVRGAWMCPSLPSFLSP
jgi:hypothetical protein